MFDTSVELEPGFKTHVNIPGAKFPFLFEVLKREGEMVEIKLSAPATPEECDQCGHRFGLSANAVTGVVTCLTTGCGKEFGYEPGQVKTVKVSDLYN